jgi:hypothetical protein
VSLVSAYGVPPSAPDLFQDGVEVGGPCDGKVYVDGQEGYAFCDDGTWACTPTDPATDGYAPLDGGVRADATMEAGVAKDAGVADAKLDATADAERATDTGSKPDR